MSIERFANGEFDVQVIPDGDGFKVVASGVAHALGFHAAKDMLRTVPADEKGWELSPTPGGQQQVWVLREPGFYRVIGQRQAERVKDAAVREQVKRFQSWVYGEVLPSLRKTGSYSVTKPMSELEMAQRYVAALEREQQLTAKVKELEPSAAAWDTLAEASGDYSVREAAQILDRDPMISTGQNRLFAYLREIRWIDSTGRPYQSQVDNGRLVCRPTSYTHPHNGEPVLTSQIRVTVRGLRYLHGKLGGVAPLRFEQVPLDEAG